MARSSSVQVLQLFVLLSCALQALGSYGLGVRKEWRSLTNTEKSDYIRAVKCLQNKPGHYRDFRHPGVVSRFDDMVFTHITKTPNIHFNGQFLPWHRYFVMLHEFALRYECDYKGYQPYWDQSLDLPPKGTWLASPIFDAVTGFGGNGASVPIPSSFKFFGVDMTILSLTGQGPVSNARGNAAVQGILPPLVRTRTGGGCITSGPFKDVPIRLGPANSTANNRRCLNRDFAPDFLDLLGLPAVLQQVQSTATYDELINVLEPVHGVGHAGVGGILGEMNNLFSSPNDPLFFLHHANLDRVWWNWQNINLTKRLKEVTGFAYSTGNVNVTLAFQLDARPYGPLRAIQDVMDIRQLGYVYST